MGTTASSILTISLVVLLSGSSLVHADKGAGEEAEANLDFCGPERSLSEAMAELCTTTEFASGFVGYAGRPSTQACAFAVVFEQPDAVAHFVNLFEEADIPGQLYALAGLRLHAKSTFRALVAQAHYESVAPVHTQFGCIISQDPPSELLDQIENGKITKGLRLFLEARAESRESN